MPDVERSETNGLPAATLERADLQRLFDALQSRGFEVLGPTVRDGAIVYDPLSGPAQLPAGWTDEQQGGRYRLSKRDDDALFGYVVGPHSWKGVDRDSPLLAHVFDERDPGVKRLIETVVQTAHAHHRPVGICGQAPSDHPDFAEWLATLGIDSISLTPDSLLEVARRLAP